MDTTELFRPRLAGELAMLSYPHLPRELTACRQHLFRLHEAEPVRVAECQSGYLQRGECLVCGHTTARLDATWWTQSPTAEARDETRRAMEAQGKTAPQELG